MNKIKHILSETKSHLRRFFNPGRKKWLHCSVGGFLDLLPGFGCGFDFCRSFVFAFINAPAVIICKSKIYGLYHLPSEFIDMKLNDSQTEISHYVNYAGGKPQKLPLENIINFMIPDT